jgi:hypothetical protein
MFIRVSCGNQLNDCVLENTYGFRSHGRKSSYFKLLPSLPKVIMHKPFFAESRKNSLFAWGRSPDRRVTLIEPTKSVISSRALSQETSFRPRFPLRSGANSSISRRHTWCCCIDRRTDSRYRPSGVLAQYRSGNPTHTRPRYVVNFLDR